MGVRWEFCEDEAKSAFDSHQFLCCYIRRRGICFHFEFEIFLHSFTLIRVKSAIPPIS
nr:MAG TPA: hypothetical protein [Caudoviricetes sp.]